MSVRLFGITALLVCVACGREAASPSATECDLKTTGPLIEYSYDLAPVPAPTGGDVPDGIYDLINVVDHTKASGPGSSNQAPSFRWAIRFVADDRSPSHVEGRLLSAIDIPPANQCEVGRFALVGTEFRSLSKVTKIDTEQYSATADGLILETKGTSYVFRRRP